MLTQIILESSEMIHAFEDMVLRSVFKMHLSNCAELRYCILYISRKTL